MTNGQLVNGIVFTKSRLSDILFSTSNRMLRRATHSGVYKWPKKSDWGTNNSRMVCKYVKMTYLSLLRKIAHFEDF